MRVYEDANQLRDALTSQRVCQKTVGFIPTMGALHDGHLSLVKTSMANHDVTVVSIFVNPTQFGPREDFLIYPRPLQQDKKKLHPCGDSLILFLPQLAQMYPQFPTMSTRVEVPSLGRLLCGKTRKNHFGGVALIVIKLCHMVGRCTLYLGEKDFQQLVIIRRLVDDLNLPVEVRGCPIYREPNGLAMSSRNQYLSMKDRKQAGAIFTVLSTIKQTFLEEKKSPTELIVWGKKYLEARGIETEYLQGVDAKTLRSKKRWRSGDRIVYAGKLSGVRLIDNLAL